MEHISGTDDSRGNNCCNHREPSGAGCRDGHPRAAVPMAFAPRPSSAPHHRCFANVWLLPQCYHDWSGSPSSHGGGLGSQQGLAQVIPTTAFRCVTKSSNCDFLRIPLLLGEESKYCISCTSDLQIQRAALLSFLYELCLCVMLLARQHAVILQH